MTTIFINNKKVKHANNKETIKEFSHSLFEDIIEKEDIITGFTADGESYPYEEDHDIMNEVIGKFDNINFQTINSIDFAFEALDSCQDYIENLTESIMKLTTAYQKSDFEQANLIFSDVIELLDLYIQLISKIYSTIKRNKPSLIENSQSIQNLEIHLLSVLKALIPAKENNDYIMLCDLLEYELIDNLTQWKIKIIPNLKKLKNT